MKLRKCVRQMGMSITRGKSIKTEAIWTGAQVYNVSIPNPSSASLITYLLFRPAPWVSPRVCNGPSFHSLCRCSLREKLISYLRVAACVLTTSLEGANRFGTWACLLTQAFVPKSAVIGPMVSSMTLMVAAFQYSLAQP